MFGQDLGQNASWLFLSLQLDLCTFQEESTLPLQPLCCRTLDYRPSMLEKKDHPTTCSFATGRMGASGPTNSHGIHTPQEFHESLYVEPIFWMAMRFLFFSCRSHLVEECLHKQPYPVGKCSTNRLKTATFGQSVGQQFPLKQDIPSWKKARQDSGRSTLQLLRTPRTLAELQGPLLPNVNICGVRTEKEAALPPSELPVSHSESSRAAALMSCHRYCSGFECRSCCK